jgi:hypothetical protein
VTADSVNPHQKRRNRMNRITCLKRIIIAKTKGGVQNEQANEK